MGLNIVRAGLLAASLGLAACPAVLAAADRATPPAHDISGVWWIEHYDPRLAPMDGSPVPYTPEGRAAHEQNEAAIAAGTFQDAAIDKCLLGGVPREMLSAYPLKIVQHDRTVTVIHEQNHAFWHAVVGAAHHGPDEVDAAFMGGDSVAKWDGDTLVIDSTGFKPSFLDETGMTHSDALHVVQRWRKIDHSARLEALITVDDPAVFAKAWTARRTYEWRPDIKIMEYVCGDPHRALTGDRVQAVRMHRKES